MAAAAAAAAHRGGVGGEPAADCVHARRRVAARARLHRLAPAAAARGGPGSRRAGGGVAWVGSANRRSKGVWAGEEGREERGRVDAPGRRGEA